MIGVFQCITFTLESVIQVGPRHGLPRGGQVAVYEICSIHFGRSFSACGLGLGGLRVEQVKYVYVENSWPGCSFLGCMGTHGPIIHICELSGYECTCIWGRGLRGILGLLILHTPLVKLNMKMKF